jgi:hypothetical protein
MSNLDQITRASAATTIAGVSPALRDGFGATRTRKSEQPFSVGENHGFVLLDRSMGGASLGGALVACTVGCRRWSGPMTITARFGRKLKVPSTFQIKHQLLHLWQKDQLAKEAAERRSESNVPYKIGPHCDEVKVHATSSAAMRAGVESG